MLLLMRDDKLDQAIPTVTKVLVKEASIKRNKCLLFLTPKDSDETIIFECFSGSERLDFVSSDPPSQRF
jgi:hypothetical protein